MKKTGWQATVIAIFILAACLFMAGDWVYRNVPMGMEYLSWPSGETLEECDANYDRLRLADLPLYDHLGSSYRDTGYRLEDDSIESVVYVKRGSPFTLRYWRTLFQQSGMEEERLPTRIIYTDYSYNEVCHYWRELQALPKWGEFMYDSYKVTGGLVWDQDTGYHVELILEGKDAEYVWEHLEMAYGNFVVKSDKPDSYFRKMMPQTELAVYEYGVYAIYKETSREYTG